MTMKSELTGKGASGLDLERMVPEYFHPDIMSGEITDLVAPSVNELIFLGRRNIWEIKSFLNEEKKKLQALVSRGEKELKGLWRKTPGEIQRERSADDGHIYCNWHGMGYGKLPECLEEKLTDAEAYRKAVYKRERKIFACRFGRNVAEWCSKVPAPHSCDHKCSRRTEATLETCGKERCAHYEACHGVVPFDGEICVFDHVDDDALKRCKDYLLGVITDYKMRLNFVEEYIAKLSEAESSEDCVNKPIFDLDPKNNLFECKHEDRVVMLTISGGKPILKHGVVGRIKGIDGKEDVWYLVADNEPLLSAVRISSKDDHRRRFNGIVMKEDSFKYLVTNEEFRQVWLKMAEFFGTGFDANTMAQILSNSK